MSSQRFLTPAVPEEMRQDREIVLAAVSQKGYVLGYASEDLMADREIVLTAVRPPLFFREAHPHRRSDARIACADTLADSGSGGPRTCMLSLTHTRRSPFRPCWCTKPFVKTFLVTRPTEEIAEVSRADQMIGQESRR